MAIFRLRTHKIRQNFIGIITNLPKKLDDKDLKYRTIEATMDSFAPAILKIKIA